MSQADEKLNDAKEAFSETLNHLSALVIDRVEGVEDYDGHVRDLWRTKLAELIQMRDELRW